MENIAYGNPDAKWEQVVEASQKATAHDFIERLPQGYDTFVGESGTKLSGGERQRIAIARALMGKPRLLILDEPDNHLDNSSIKNLMENLKNLDPVPSILIISHNMEILRDVKEINILDRGGVALRGNYADLAGRGLNSLGAQGK
jgi:ABC-type bacteriocin/lantibiotic exporter with double-glycine peptidase domain